MIHSFTRVSIVGTSSKHAKQTNKNVSLKTDIASIRKVSWHVLGDLVPVFASTGNRQSAKKRPVTSGDRRDGLGQR